MKPLAETLLKRLILVDLLLWPKILWLPIVVETRNIGETTISLKALALRDPLKFVKTGF